MSIQIPSFSVSKNTNNSKVRFYCVSVFSQTPITLFDSDAEAEKKRRCMLYFLFLAKAFEELRDEGVREAEKGNIGKALSLLSHAATLNDKDYKTFEMIAQVVFCSFHYH